MAWLFDGRLFNGSFRFITVHEQSRSISSPENSVVRSPDPFPPPCAEKTRKSLSDVAARDYLGSLLWYYMPVS